MGLLDKAEELEDQSEETEEEEEEVEKLHDDKPRKKKKKAKVEKPGAKKKKKKKSPVKEKGKPVKKKRKKAPAPAIDDEEDDYYAAPPPKKKKKKAKKKVKRPVREEEFEEEEVMAKPRKHIDPRVLPYSPLGKRFGAVAIDYLLMCVVFAGFLVFYFQNNVEKQPAPVYFTVFWIDVPLVYFILFEGIIGNRSLGKILLGTEIINKYGEKPSIKEALVSALGKGLAFPFFVPVLPIIDTVGLFWGRSSRFYQRKLEHKVHLFVVDHAKFRGLDTPLNEDDDYFGSEENGEDFEDSSDMPAP